MNADPSVNLAKLEQENAQLRAEVAALKQALDRGEEALALGEVRLRLAYLATIQALVRAIEAKDPYTVGHSTMVSKVAVAIARRLDLTEDEQERVRIAGTLLDVGKIGIAREILVKTDDLTPAERETLETHVKIGVQIVEPILYPWDVAALIYQHHERLDGSGYPSRLPGDQIELEAKILGLADSFVAMLARRAYREPLTETEVTAHFHREAGRTFDETCVSHLLDLLGSDPDLRAEIDRFKSTVYSR